MGLHWIIVAKLSFTKKKKIKLLQVDKFGLLLSLSLSRARKF